MHTGDSGWTRLGWEQTLRNRKMASSPKLRRVDYIRAVAIAAILAGLSVSGTAYAAAARCSQPVSADNAGPSASDCLFILRAAVSLTTCEPECVCRPAGGERATTRDALLCLQKASLLRVVLDCRCPGDTTYVVDASEADLSYREDPSYGFCPASNIASATVERMPSGQHVLDMSLIDGDEDCYHGCFGGWFEGCPPILHLPRRMLTDDEEEQYRRLMARFQLDAEAHWWCDEDITVDLSSEISITVGGLFSSTLYCGTPTLDYDQIFRVLDVLAAFRDGY